jgi:hypothetical protein
MGDWSQLNGQIKSKKLSARKIFQAVLDRDEEEWGGEFLPDNKFDVTIDGGGEKIIKYTHRIIASALQAPCFKAG